MPAKLVGTLKFDFVVRPAGAKTLVGTSKLDFVVRTTGATKPDFALSAGATKSDFVLSAAVELMLKNTVGEPRSILALGICKLLVLIVKLEPGVVLGSC
jgi:hypothetical protein